VFSPEHIPHDEKLFVQFQRTRENNTVVNEKNEKKEKKSVSSEESSQTETSDVTSEGSAEELEFEWDVKWNSLYCGYNLQDKDRTITTGTLAVSRSTSMPILISNRCFKKRNWCLQMAYRF